MNDYSVIHLGWCQLGELCSARAVFVIEFHMYRKKKDFEGTVNISYVVKSCRLNTREQSG